MWILIKCASEVSQIIEYVKGQIKEALYFWLVGNVWWLVEVLWNESMLHRSPYWWWLVHELFRHWFLNLKFFFFLFEFFFFRVRVVSRPLSNGPLNDVPKIEVLISVRVICSKVRAQVRGQSTGNCVFCKESIFYLNKSNLNLVPQFWSWSCKKIN